MIVPVPALQAATGAGLPSERTGAQAIQVADRPQVPSSQDAADFARAAAAPSRLAEIQSSLPASPGGIGASLAHQVEQIAQHLNSLASNAPMPANAGTAAGTAAAATTSAPGVKPPSLSQADTSAAVAQIEHAYMFAIETTMASRGSTESTKIFNTLLKGQ